MKKRSTVIRMVIAGCCAFLGPTLLVSCAPTVLPTTPPDSYKGPITEQPVLQQGDYWIYQAGSLTRGRTATLAVNICFPLWLGKVWTYDGEALLQGQPTTSSQPGAYENQLHNRRL